MGQCSNGLGRIPNQGFVPGSTRDHALNRTSMKRQVSDSMFYSSACKESTSLLTAATVQSRSIGDTSVFSG